MTMRSAGGLLCHPGQWVGECVGECLRRDIEVGLPRQAKHDFSTHKSICGSLASVSSDSMVRVWSLARRYTCYT